MLNPNNPVHRQRFATSVEYARSELERFARMRENTVRAYLGVPPTIPGESCQSRNRRYDKSLPKGNLLQMAALNQQIALAYGEPEYLTTARTPNHAGMADKLDPALNRMSKLLDLGETARQVAADSFFGYGIFKAGIGLMPLSSQKATGLKVGPCVWRVSQYNYLYDITATVRSNCKWEGDVYSMPLDEAAEIWPEKADKLQVALDTDRLDAPRVFTRPTGLNAPELEVRLFDCYFPSAGLVATWLVRNGYFGSLAEEYLGCREYDGHWSGVYEVLTHLYSPDELLPIAQAESVKAIHFLFNDLFEITAHQAVSAKINPIHTAGSDKDMSRVLKAADRAPVAVVGTGPDRMGLFEVPGPTASQTQYMAAVMQLFKQFVPLTDEPARAATATQSALERQSTNAIIGEARRKFNRSLQLVGYKLGHLLMNDNSIMLPSSRPVFPGSQVSVDMSWYPASREPRVAMIDDFDISIEPYSTVFRSPEEKRNLIISMMDQVTRIMQARAMGAPVNVEKAINLLARYSGLPELNELFEELTPTEAAQRQASRMQSIPRPGVGQYVRENVSTKTEAGALEQNLQGVGENNGQVAPRLE